MTTTNHDTSVSWTECPVCSELHRAYEQADAALEKVWTSYSFFDTTYREALDAGMVVFGTPAWSRWHDLLDQLLHAYYAAADIIRARREAWGESIREHAKPQRAEPAEAPAQTEEMVAISKADAVDELVNVYGGHIDKWLAALRERTAPQPTAAAPREHDWDAQAQKSE